MVVRRRKKIRKYRGSRTCGWGITGQHRGKGQKGGFGRSGRHKHHWTWVRKYAPDYFGKHGFKTPLSMRANEKVINIGLLDEIASELLRKGKAELKESKVVINVLELGYNKVLGRGKVTRPLIVITPYISKKAEEKISQAGGEVIKV
ncbi:MAG: 50S ribosomal protein L15 [archaeon GB-1867-035]|nr:50S ribosomal protein L15 [Candidatus Culexmicrobium profundum]